MTRRNPGRQRTNHLPVVMLLCLVTGAAALAQSNELAEIRAIYEADRAELERALAVAADILPEEHLRELLASQSAWLEAREEFALQAAFAESRVEREAAATVPGYWWALAAATAWRIDYVYAWVHTYAHDRAPASDWEGLWVDSWGGRVYIAGPEDGAIRFGIEVVRGPTYHMGEISGIAMVEGDTATFSVVPAEGFGETVITFVLVGPELLVAAENSSYFHGARAYFDGAYVRLGDVVDPAIFE